MLYRKHIDLHIPSKCCLCNRSMYKYCEINTINQSLIMCFPPAQVERDKKVGKLSGDTATQQTLEILTALKKLGEQLSSNEEQYLMSNSSSSLREFEKVSSEIGRKFVYICLYSRSRSSVVCVFEIFKYIPVKVTVIYSML